MLSREELYSQVWTMPISRLAAQYGITGTGLAKICARPKVSCLRRGYAPAAWLAWAKDWLEQFDPLKRKPEELFQELVHV